MTFPVQVYGQWHAVRTFEREWADCRSPASVDSAGACAGLTGMVRAAEQPIKVLREDACVVHGDEASWLVKSGRRQAGTCSAGCGRALARASSGFGGHCQLSPATRPRLDEALRKGSNGRCRGWIDGLGSPTYHQVEDISFSTCWCLASSGKRDRITGNYTGSIRPVAGCSPGRLATRGGSEKQTKANICKIVNDSPGRV